jgi:hypothetical protein
MVKEWLEFGLNLPQEECSLTPGIFNHFCCSLFKVEQKDASFKTSAHLSRHFVPRGIIFPGIFCPG